MFPPTEGKFCVETPLSLWRGNFVLFHRKRLPILVVMEGKFYSWEVAWCVKFFLYKIFPPVEGKICVGDAMYFSCWREILYRKILFICSYGGKFYVPKRLCDAWNSCLYKNFSHMEGKFCVGRGLKGPVKGKFYVNYCFMEKDYPSGLWRGKFVFLRLVMWCFKVTIMLQGDRK